MSNATNRAADPTTRLACAAGLLSAIACATATPAPERPVAPGAPVAASADTAPEPEWRAARGAMRKACAAKEWDTCRAATARAVAASSGNADLVYNLGAIDALRGDKEAALAGLRRYLALGLGHDAGADEDFASLKGDPRFTALLGLLAANRSSVGAPSEVARLAPNDLLTEDVAHDPATGTFYVTSVHTRQVLALQQGAPARPLLADGPGLLGMMALGLDRARGRLWIASAAIPHAAGLSPADAGRTALLAVSLDGGRVLQRFELPAAGKRMLADLTVAPDGTVYVSDGLGAGVYQVAPGGSALELIAGRADFLSPQTPALDAARHTLLVPDYSRGIALLDLRTRAVRWLAHGDEVALNGIDGLYLRSPRELIAVQNGTEPPRVLRLRLDQAGERVVAAEVLARGGSLLGDPTHGVLVGDDFIVIAHAGWGSFNDDGSLKPGEPKEAPRLLRLPLGPLR